MELTGYLAVARRWWWTLLVATWVAAMAGLLVASRITPTYEAQTQLLVGPINTDADTLKASGQLVQTYAQLAISAEILQSTAREVPGLDPQKLAASVRTTASDVTRVLQIRVQDSDPARAAKIADTMSTELIQLTAGTTTRPEGELQVISPAVAPTSPIAPQVSLIVLLAMAAGLIGGLVLVILVEYATDMVRDSADLARLGRADVLATIAFDQRTPGADPLPVAAATAPGAVNATAFRLLASKVAVGEGDTQTRTILVTAIGPGDSAIGATGIAAAVAASGRRVVVVDGAADGDITQTLRLGGRPGLREAGSSDRDPSLVPLMGPAGIHVLPSGAEGSVELLSIERTRAIIDKLLADHDLVIVDGGAVQRSPGALSWARVADHSVVLVRRGLSRREDLRLAMESLRYVNARISGTVLVQRTTGRRIRSRRARAAEAGLSAQPTSASNVSASTGPTAQGTPFTLGSRSPSEDPTATLARRLEGVRTIGAAPAAGAAPFVARSPFAAIPAPAAAASPSADPRLGPAPAAPWQRTTAMTTPDERPGSPEQPASRPTGSRPAPAAPPVALGPVTLDAKPPIPAEPARRRRAAARPAPEAATGTPATPGRSKRGGPARDTAFEPTPITAAPSSSPSPPQGPEPTELHIVDEAEPGSASLASAAGRSHPTEA